MAYPPASLPTNATDGASPSDTTPTAVLTAAEVNATNAAVNDIVTELGSNPSGTDTTVAARLDGIESDITALGSGSIPDGSVSTAKLANGAVTAAKVAADVATQAELDAETAARTAAIAGLSGTYARKVADWATGVAYSVGELVVSSGTLYRCTTVHTAGGSFAGGNFTAIGGGGSTVTVDADGTLVVNGTTVEVGTDAEIAAAIAAARLPMSAVLTAPGTAVAETTNRFNASAGSIAVTAPAVGAAGAMYAVMKTDASSNAVTVAGVSLVVQGAAATFKSDGSAWVLVDSSPGSPLVSRVMVDGVFTPVLEIDSTPMSGGSANVQYAAKIFRPTGSLAIGSGVSVISGMTGVTFNKGMVLASQGIQVPVAGLYSIVGCIKFNVDGTVTSRGAIVFVNGTSVGETSYTSGTANDHRVNTSQVLQLGAGDVVALGYVVNAASTISSDSAKDINLAVYYLGTAS